MQEDDEPTTLVDMQRDAGMLDVQIGTRHVLFVEFPRGSKLTRASAINLASKGVPALDNEQAIDEFMQRIAESIAGAFYTSIYE